MLDDDATANVLKKCGGDVPKLRAALREFLDEMVEAVPLDEEFETRPSMGFQRVIQRALHHVLASEKEEVKGVNLLIATYAEADSHAAYLLKQAGVERLDVVSYVSHGMGKGPVTGGQDPSNSFAEAEEEGGVEGDPLEAFCDDLTAQARDGLLDVLVGRGKEMTRTVHILCRRRKNNPLYVGESGVGKTSLAEGLAQRIVSGDVPEPLQGAELFSLDMGALLAGTRYRGDFENR